ncbi:MAG: DUF6882 domain-containing protein [Imperialibacter sp.]|uniref:DUF6882 domain-containing protein n=1 Tax=Imperialibacter sp. TaxID=2038411 RepID=UPI003A84E725
MNQQDLTKPDATDEFVDYLTQSYDYLTERQEICKNEFGLSTYQRWSYDQETGLIEFFNGDSLMLRISYQEVGSVSKSSNTWLWAWSNSYLLENIKLDSRVVREFGERKQFERLTKNKWYADETDGWEMTAVMAYLTGAKGAYRIPGENVISFIVFTELEKID